MRKRARNFILMESDDDDDGEAVAATAPVSRHLTRRNVSSGEPNQSTFFDLKDSGLEEDLLQHPPGTRSFEAQTTYECSPMGTGIHAATASQPPAAALIGNKQVRDKPQSIAQQDDRSEAPHAITHSRGPSLPPDPKASTHFDSAPTWNALQLGSELSPEGDGEAAHETMYDGFGNPTMLVPQCKRQRLRIASPDYNPCEAAAVRSMHGGMGKYDGALEVAAEVEGVDATMAGNPQPRTVGGENEPDWILLPRAASFNRTREPSVSPRRDDSRAAGGMTHAAGGQTGDGDGGSHVSDDSGDIVPEWKELPRGGRIARPGLVAAVAAAAPDDAAMTGGSGGEGYALAAASSLGGANCGNGCVPADPDAMAAAAPILPHIGDSKCTERGCKQRQEEEEERVVQEQEDTASLWCSARQQSACMQRQMEQQVLEAPSRARCGRQSTEIVGPECLVAEGEEEVEEEAEGGVAGNSRDVRRGGGNNGGRDQRAAKRGGKVTISPGSSDDDDGTEMEKEEEDMGDDGSGGAIADDKSNAEEELDYVPRKRRGRRNASSPTVNTATKTAKPVRSSPPEQRTRSKRRSSLAAAAAVACMTLTGREQRIEDSDDEDDMPVKKRSCALKAAARRLTDTGKAEEDEEVSRGSGGGNGGQCKRSGRLCRTSMTAVGFERDEDMLQDALEDDDMGMGDSVPEPDVKQARARSAANVPSDAAAAGDDCNGAGGSRPLGRRPVKQRKALTLAELREKARQKLEGTFGTQVGASDGDETDEVEQSRSRRRHRLQHPGLQDDCDAELAAHVMFDADEAALEDETEPNGRGNLQRRAATEEEDDSFINDGEVEEDAISGDEVEEEEEPRTRSSGDCAAARASEVLRSPPVAAQLDIDQVENFKSWVTPMICDLLHLRLVAENECELEQERRNQKARTSRFENALCAARKRTMSYSWVHAVTKLGLNRALERYPILLIDDTPLSQFYGLTGTRAVQEEIAREMQMPGRSQPYLDGLNDDISRCDICHAHRTHRLHTLSLKGDPIDFNGDNDDGGTTGVTTPEDEGKRETREFLAGGMCCDRIVLYHALCHFKRWLLASIKKRLKHLLQNHLRRRGPDGMWPDGVRSEVMLQMLRNSDKYLTAMYCRCKELLDAEQKLYISQSSGRKEGRFMPGRQVAEVMSDVHQSIDGYESDISGIPEEDEEGEDSGVPNSDGDGIAADGSSDLRGNDGDDGEDGDVDEDGRGQAATHDARRIPESQLLQQRGVVFASARDEEDGSAQDASAPIATNRTF
ncbi:hypothetical protein Vafri_19220, partial [Volvox africanus]